MGMTVYELIQHLSRFKADTPVEFRVKAIFDADVTAHFDRENEKDEQDVTVTAEFNDTVSYDGICNEENDVYNPKVTIELNY